MTREEPFFGAMRPFCFASWCVILALHTPLHTLFRRYHDETTFFPSCGGCSGPFAGAAHRASGLGRFLVCAGYYATHYPDVAAPAGTDEGALLQHYIQFGASEGRKPSAWGRAGDTDLKLTDDQIAAIWSPGAHQGTGQLQKPEAQDDR